MFFIIFHLNLTAAPRLINSHLHRVRNRVRIHDNMPFCISRGTPDRLDQGCLRTQEAFFVRIKDRHKCDLRDIKSLTEKVDPDKHIKYIQTHIADNLCTFQCIHIRMQIFHPDAHFSHIIRKILCHTLCQCCNKNFIFLGDLFVDLADQIIDLSLDRTYRHLRIKKSCRPDHLLCPQEFVFFLIRSRRSRYKQDLINLTLKFFKIQGTVILRRRQTEPVIHQRTLSRLVAVVHASDLRDRLVGLVDHHNEVIWEIIDQGIRRLPRRKPCQMTGIILDSRAESRLLEHLDIKICPLCNTLCFQKFVLPLEFFHTLVQLFLNIMHRSLYVLFIHNIVGGRKDCHVL